MAIALGLKVSNIINIFLFQNYMRVVEVWLDDEFKEYFYTREPSVRGYPVGDLTKQLQFKKDHNCKSFKWFMDNVAYEVYDRFPVLPPNKAWGEVSMEKSSRITRNSVFRIYDQVQHKPGCAGTEDG